MYGEYDEMKRKIQQLTNELKVSTWSDPAALSRVCWAVAMGVAVSWE